MTLAEALSKVNQQAQQQAAAQPQQPLLGPAPQTKPEADAIRQQNAANQEANAVARMRIQQLAGSIFTRLVSDPRLVDPSDDSSVVKLTPKGKLEIDQDRLVVIGQVNNRVASILAQIHAQEVWGLTLTQPSAQQMPPQPQ